MSVPIAMSDTALQVLHDLTKQSSYATIDEFVVHLIRKAEIARQSDLALLHTIRHRDDPDPESDAWVALAGGTPPPDL